MDLSRGYSLCVCFAFSIADKVNSVLPSPEFLIWLLLLCSCLNCRSLQAMCPLL